MKLLSVVDVFPMQAVMIIIEYLYVVLACRSVNVKLYELLALEVPIMMALCLSALSLSTPLYLMI